MLHGALENSTKQRSPVLHAESLLRLPLVQQLLTDPANTLMPRALDQNWFYQKAISDPVHGFHPYHSTVYYPAISCFAEWLKNPYASARDTNTDDRLIREVLFSTHDYLHGWAVRAIRELLPDLGFGTAPITNKNIEAMVFCHLLTEAAAVVGLDYWYLATIDVNDVCPIGTMINFVTVTYHENDLPEYRRFHPKLDVQAPDFFEKIAVFYCTGEFEGFDLTDLKQSPKLMKWITHELRYGACQRDYTRQWFAHISADAIRHTPEQLHAEVECSKKWQKQLMRDLGALLWEKVKKDKMHKFAAIAPNKAWSTPKGKRQDFRFLNLNTVPESEIEWSHCSAKEFQILFAQWLCRHDFETFDAGLISLFDEVLQLRDLKVAGALFKDLQPLKIPKKEPKDLFFLP
jgi:hypothetical protein